MHFSRVRIATGNLAQVALLKVLQGDAYSIHQLVWKLFPNDPEKKRGFLFRQEFEKEQISFSETRRGMPEVLLKGLGHSKAFGCGLMLVRRLP